ncbi:MAG: MFS transporter [Gammaproteobacteria bacterium]|nr:MFS transporter [Gammaproteobacteria bacterium]MDH3465250.1 MFS transporter [Gammaproteobacteria bacterium]
MRRSQLSFLFLNIGHFLDHFFLLVFATVAALRLSTEWGMSYAELIPYATPGFIAFGICAIPAGWLADKWSREGMMVIFFVGIGASSLFAGFADTPLQIGISLTLVGVFAAIYHPVGLAMVVQGRSKTGVPLAINGIFGNMGVASAALLTGLFIDTVGWRSAFLIPGTGAIILGLLYLAFVSTEQKIDSAQRPSPSKHAEPGAHRKTLLRVFAVIFITTAIGGLVFQSTTFTLPKVFEERLTDLAGTATLIGSYAFLVFTVAAFAQLVVGYLVDHHSIRTVFAWVAILQATFLGIMMQLTGVAALVVAIAFMLAVFGQIPINDVLVGRMAHSEWRSRAYALRYIITFSVMASAVPLIAWIHGSWGFSALFGVLAVAALLIFVAVLFVPRTQEFIQHASSPAV